MKKFNLNYISPTPGEIPVVAGSLLTYDVIPKKGHYDDEETLKKVRLAADEASECGFNMGDFGGFTNETVDSILKGVNGSGIGIICSNEALRWLPTIIQDDEQNHIYLYPAQRLKRFVESVTPNGDPEFDYRKSLKTWSIGDEPSYQVIKTRYWNSEKLLSELTPDIMSFFNLSLSDTIDVDGNEMSYANYLEYLQNNYPQALWSYDFYPVVVRNNVTIVEYEAFFKFLKLFSDISLKSGRPFWTYVLSMSYKAYGYNANNEKYVKRYCPAPTRGSLLFEVFSALAMGAQGIQYFAYTLRGSALDSDGKIKEEYLIAPIDLEGNRTEVWYIVQEVNALIKKYTRVFLGAKLTACYHANSNSPYGGIPILTSKVGPLVGITNATHPLLVTTISNNGIRYLILVNENIQSSQTVDLSFENVKILMEVTPFKPDLGSPSQLPTNTLRRTIEPGGFLIYKY